MHIRQLDKGLPWFLTAKTTRESSFAVLALENFCRSVQGPYIPYKEQGTLCRCSETGILCSVSMLNVNLVPTEKWPSQNTNSGDSGHVDGHMSSSLLVHLAPASLDLRGDCFLKER